MLEQLKQKDSEQVVEVIRGELPEIPTSEKFDLITIVDNTFLLLPTQQSQARLIRNAADRLRPGGVLIVESEADEGVATEQLSLHSIGDDQVVIWAHQVDLDTQRFKVSEIILRDGSVKVLPFEGRYASGAELDLMADFAGLSKVGRFRSWDLSSAHREGREEISVFQKGVGSES